MLWFYFPHKLHLLIIFDPWSPLWVSTLLILWHYFSHSLYIPGLHSRSTYIVFFQTTDALKLFLTQTALTFPWPMVSNMVYQITDTMKMLLKQNLCVILAILWFMHRVFQKAVVFLTNAFWNKLTFQLSTSSLIGSLGWFGLAVSAYC